jgi:hypothetical protein
MGPAFAIVFIATLGLLVFALAYGVTCIFFTRLVALVASAAFVVGGCTGATAFLVTAWLVRGSTSFTNQWQVVTFLSSLALSAVLAGAMLAFASVRVLRWSNISSKRTREKPRAA